MAALLVIAHAPLASSLAAVAAHVFPDCGRQLAALDIDPGGACDDIRSGVRAAVDTLAARGDGEVLVMVDVYGATPANAARDAADGHLVQVVAGVNVPMLWRTLCYAHLPLGELVERALAGGGSGVMRVLPEQPATASVERRS